jgi:hypothetical protein
MKNHSSQKRIAGILVATVLCFGAMPAVAGAQGNQGGSLEVGPTSAQYDPDTITFQNQTNDPSAGSGLNDSVGPLPFTGFDVIAMLAVALAVTGLGLALQRAVSREPRDLR